MSPARPQRHPVRTVLIVVAALAVTLGFAPATAGSARAAAPTVTQIIVWGDSMTQVWPVYLGQLLGVPVVNNGVGSTSVQQTQASFNTWVNAHRSDADFATTAHICWCGHTNLNGPNMRDPQMNASTVVPTQVAMAARVPAGLYLPVSLSNGPEAPRGSAGYLALAEDGLAATRTAINERLQTAFPTTYTDVREFLIDGGLAYTGLAPTAEDLQNISVDVPPRTLRTDNGNPAHLSEPGRRAAAYRLAQKVRELGWVAPAPTDRDGDGVPDATDVCPTVADPDQRDRDRDGSGDACRKAVAVSLIDADLSEERLGVWFSISLDGPVTVPASVSWSTSNGTALAGSDYVAASGTVTFAPYQQLAFVRLTTLDDSVQENTEKFNLALSSPSDRLKPGIAKSRIKINDNDPPNRPDPLPYAAAVNPPSEGQTISQTTLVSIDFSEPVTGVSTASFRLTTPTGAVVPARVTYNAAQRRATLSPTSTLAGDTRYTASVTSSIRDGSGQPLPLTRWQFITGPAPTVLSSSPSAGSTGVPRTSQISVTFSESVLNVSDESFVLTDSNGDPVPAAVTRNGASNTWVLTPASDLDRNETYTVSLAGGALAIRDLEYNLLTGQTFTFRT